MDKITYVERTAGQDFCLSAYPEGLNSRMVAYIYEEDIATYRKGKIKRSTDYQDPQDNASEQYWEAEISWSAYMKARTLLRNYKNQTEV